MSYIDIAIIAIVALFAILGLAKGFFKTLIGFFGWLVSLIAAIFLAKIVAEALLDVAMIKNLVVGTEGFSLYTLIYNVIPESVKNLGAGATAEQLQNAVSNNYLWIAILTMVGALTGTVAGATAAQGLALLIATNLFIMLVGIMLFIIIRIIMSILSLAAKAAVKNKAVNGLNRFLGFVLGAVRGAGYIIIIFILSSYVISLNALSGFRAELDKTIIGKPVAEIVYKYTDKYINGDDGLLNKVLELSGLKQRYEMTDDEKAIESNIDLFTKTGFTATQTTAYAADENFGYKINDLQTFFTACKGNIQLDKGRANYPDEMSAIVTSITSGGNLFNNFTLLKTNLAAYQSAADAFNALEETDVGYAAAESDYQIALSDVESVFASIKSNINALSINQLVNGATSETLFDYTPAV